MVPLRFIGEASGAFVVWNPYVLEGPEIEVYTETYWTQELGVTREQLEQLTEQAIALLKEQYEEQM